ncbi:MAG: tetratricopeptide repeat protein [Tepidisphaeraceae bacterium]
MRQLGDPNARLSASQRRKLVDGIVRGIDAALPSMKDPQLMMKQASDLIRYGVEQDVNTLEYWGENPRTQAQLRPVVTTIIKLLERCIAEARASADAAANRIKSPDDKAAIARYEQFEQLARDSEFTKYMADYDLVLSIDPADPQRRAIANHAIEYLRQFDVPDQPIRARVRNRIGKLAMAAGDYDSARKMFDAVSARDMQPPPDLATQYEARYFRALTDLLAQLPDWAMTKLDELEAWQNANLPNPAGASSDEARVRAQQARDGAHSAAVMLRYRILSQQSSMLQSADARRKLSDEATGLLFALLREQPALQPIIYEQLMSALPADAPMNTLDPLLLQAIVRRGEDELHNSQSDRKLVERALAAARELNARRERGVDPQVADNASLLAGFFLDNLDRDAESAGAFLDFVERDPRAKNATLALDNAQALIGQLRRDAGTREEPQVVGAYERFLPLAIAPPFDRREFAYEYARRLQLQGKLAQAIDFYKLVPPDDKRALAARFFVVIALQQQLDQLPRDAENRAKLVEEILSLSAQVKSSIAGAIASATSEEQKAQYSSMLVRMALLAAELARTEQNDPKLALSLLADIEPAVVVLPDASRRLSEMLLIRVQSLIATGDYSKATDELVRLLDREPARGGRIVYDLLEKLNSELDKAEASGNVAAVKQAALDRAQLTGFLVNWARNNQNPAIQKLAYGYAVFDAEVQRFAAMQESDAAARRAGLDKSLALFNSLNTPAGVESYTASLSPEASRAGISYDPSVLLGIARTQYDLGNYEQARDAFSRLLSDKRLGPALMVVEEHGQEKEIDNDNYWEAILKLIRCNIALNSGLEESKNYLKEQIVRWSDHVGGTKWKKDFAQLREELIPGYDPEHIPTTRP